LCRQNAAAPMFLAKFLLLLEDELSKIRVRKPIKDICSMCYILQNTHKYSKHK
jgi:hypothetical protein